MPSRTPLTAREFVSVFSNSAPETTLASALQMHMLAAERGLDTEVTIANDLISLFAGCRRMCYAQQIVDKLPRPDAHSWNTLILGYSRHGEAQEALAICGLIQRGANVYLNDHALLALLNASAGLNDLASGKAIHSQVIRQGGLEENPYIGSALVDMYAKCGSIEEAWCVFDILLTKDAVSWTAMIAGLVECKLNEQALHFFTKMQSDGIYLDSFSYASSLKACGRLCDLDKGYKIHAEIVEKGLEESDEFVGSGLVGMYASCGALLEANAVFTKSQLQNVVSCTMLITAFAKSSNNYEAIQFFEMMNQLRISPNLVTFVCVLKSCSAVGNVDVGLRIHDELVKRGYKKDLTVSNSLIDMYSKCGFVEEARQEFDNLSWRNVVSYNVLLAGYSGQGYNDDVFLVCKLMDLEGISPNAVTFSIILHVCSNIKAIAKGQHLHTEIIRKGFLSKEDEYVGNSLITMYAKCGLLDDARDVLLKLSVQDVISWTTIIQSYTENGCEEEALFYFEKMQQARVTPGVVTFVCCLKASGSVGALEKGQETHTQIAKKGLENEPLIGNCFVYLYAKCGALAAAEQVFFKLEVRDIVSCNALIAGYAQLGKSGKIMLILDKMVHENILPDLVTFICLLTAFSHEGEVAKGQMVFETMSDYCGLGPSFSLYACIIDLFGRSGSVDAASSVINRMPVQPGMVMWHTIIAACRKWGNVYVAEAGFEQALQLDGCDDSSYLYMFNIYVDAELHENATQINHLRGINRKRSS